MSISDDLYREIILDHYRNPRFKGELPAPALKAEGANPLCGDQVSIYLVVNGDVIEDLRIQVQGCSISAASTSMMAEAVKGKRMPEVEKLIDEFKGMMLQKNGTSVPAEQLGDLETLQGVKKYPVRIKCALLPWNTLIEALKSIKGKKPAEKVIME
ncbi:MAG: SUF system NifU family Fe-S cluster assembly protein [candidate division Zixibacteria bacterium RBG_16_50_21]|nr:MAG: SUF system NifU family Fe-S cluster assembly protein [candidate division Zixibacteria bacterium RBG_16_50_21]